MKIIKMSLLLLVLVVIIGACDNVTNNGGGGSTNTAGDWLIPKDEVLDGGPGKDGIPAIGDPKFDSVSNITGMSDNELVVVYKSGNTIRMYPHIILDWHEIVNDKIDEGSFALSYCPLTGSAMVWDRNIGGAVTTFGVSGLLFNNNLLPYDRATGSNWSQMKLLCVNGTKIGNTPIVYPVIETTWATAKRLFPEAQVMTTNTGFSRPYGSYPYGDYRTNNNKLLFSISFNDTRLPRKERVYGLIDGDNSLVFRFGDFPGTPTVKNIDFGGTKYVVIGSQSDNFLTAYKSSDKTLTVINDVQNPQNVMEDSAGNTYNIFGEITAGPQKGAKLGKANGYVSYWFAWGVFWRGAEISGS